MNQSRWQSQTRLGGIHGGAELEPVQRSPLGSLWHVWLLLTGPGDDAPQTTIKERAQLGRARATSAVIFGLLLFALLALPLGLQDPTHATLVADVILFVAIFLASALNRLGATTPAGWVLVLVLLLAIMGAIVGSPKLDFIYLPGFDLLAIPVMVAALVLPLGWVWVVGVAGAALIAADIFLQPRSSTPTTMAGFVALNGVVPLMLRPIILVLVAAILLFLFGQLLHQQVVRADRAEDLAELERRQLEQRRQLEIGVQQLLETHVRLANNDYSARANLPQDNQLWQVGASLNNLVTRLQRAGQADFELRRTREELQRLAAAIDEARAGKRPFWPAPAGTAVDLIIERIAPRTRQPLPPPHAGMEPSFSGMTPGMPGMPGAGARPHSPYPSTPYPEQSGPLNPMGGIPPMPGMPDFPAGPPATGSLNASWGQPNPFANANRRQPGENSGGGNLGNVVPENPWFAPPEDYDS
ncbi:MAG TPA: hypothetical protein VKT52_03400 [Ktedonobacterales bacterium]|nr:hypothetical protein [Ktedonobacterales bacterium]